MIGPAFREMKKPKRRAGAAGSPHKRSAHKSATDSALPAAVILHLDRVPARRSFRYLAGKQDVQPHARSCPRCRRRDHISRKAASDRGKADLSPLHGPDCRAPPHASVARRRGGGLHRALLAAQQLFAERTA
jgi:hypothetical protein